MDEKTLIPTRGDISNFQDATETITRTEAILRGYVLYWTGTPCERGHHSPRYTKSGHCKKCYQMFRAEEIDQKDISKDPLPLYGIKRDTRTPHEKLLMEYDIRELRRCAKDHGLSNIGTKSKLAKRISKYWRARHDKNRGMEET